MYCTWGLRSEQRLKRRVKSAPLWGRTCRSGSCVQSEDKRLRFKGSTLRFYNAKMALYRMHNTTALTAASQMKKRVSRFHSCVSQHSRIFNECKKTCIHRFNPLLVCNQSMFPCTGSRYVPFPDTTDECSSEGILTSLRSGVLCSLQIWASLEAEIVLMTCEEIEKSDDVRKPSSAPSLYCKTAERWRNSVAAGDSVDSLWSLKIPRHFL